MTNDYPRAEAARLRAAVDSAPSGLLVVDADGLIVLVNREVERLFGYSRDELVGQPVDILVPLSSRSHHPGFRRSFFQAPHARAMGAGRDLFGVRKDGSEVPVEIGLTPVETEDGLYVISAIVDISARKQAEKERLAIEEQLRQSQKMEAIGRLAGGIAHDFNNILGMITGFAELARAPGIDPVTRAADLDELLRAASRGRDLVLQILRFSRRQEVRLMPVDLRGCISDCVRLLRASLPASIEIRLRHPADLPKVLGDQTQLHQVTMNLATNAAHAMSAGGVLEIEVEPFYAYDSFVRAHPNLREGPYVRMTVRDTGHGMDAQTQSRAFEPFFTTKPAGAGTGLGLSMVHGIVNDHGGAVWLSSELGAGTEVSCLLPIHPGEAESDAIEVVSSQRSSKGGVRVLFVDDEPTLLEIGKRRLIAAGHSVHTAATPREAIERFGLKRDSIDLVITDLTMPEMNGLELATAIHRISATTPVILLTGYMHDFAPAELEAAGISRVLYKPVGSNDLLEAIQSIMAEQPQAGAFA